MLRSTLPLAPLLLSFTIYHASSETGGVVAFLLLAPFASTHCTPLRMTGSDTDLSKKTGGSTHDLAEEFASASDTIPSLASLPLIPYIDDNGLITKCEGEESAKSSAFAIYDKNKMLQYIGTTRKLHQSLKVMLARQPDKTYYYKSFHVAKPSRTLLELVTDWWLAECGVPPGNGEGEEQRLWERPLDVKPLMTEADYADITELENQGHLDEEMAMKIVTSARFEEDKMTVLKSRGVKEELHFDLGLKAEGLLDLKVEDVHHADKLQK